MSDTQGAAPPTTEQAPTEPAAIEQATPTTTSTPTEGAAPENAENEGTETEQAAPEGEESEGPKRLTRNQRLQRKAARLATMVAEQAAELERFKQASEKSSKESEPKEADYNGDWTKYQADYAAWKAAQMVEAKLSEREERDLKRQTAERQQEAAEDFLERAEATRKLIPDYDAAIAAFANSGGQFAPHVIEEVRDSDKGPELAYHIAKTPGLANQLNALSPRDAAREIGRLEARLALPQPRKQTQAPAPLTALKGGAAPAFDPNKSDDMGAYIEWRKKGGGGPPLR